MYSEIIQNSKAFMSSDIFETMRDICSYKLRNQYIMRLYYKYYDYDFGNSEDNKKLEIFKNQCIHIGSCGSYLTFRTLEDDMTVGKLVNGSFCRQRICPLCQRRKSLKVYSNILQMLEPIREKYSFLHLSLTIPNVNSSEASASITNIFNWSKKLFNNKEVKKSFRGVIRSLEVTYNPHTNMLHPHLHCLVIVNKSYFTSRDYIKQCRLCELWSDITGNDMPQIYIRKCNDLNGAVREVVKYAAKPIDMDSDFDDMKSLLYYMNVAYALRGRRLLQVFGIAAELSEAFHVELNDDEEEFSFSEDYTVRQCYDYDLEREEFLMNFERSKNYGLDLKGNPYMHKQFQMVGSLREQKKKELISYKANIALKKLLEMKKSKN